MDLIWDKEFAEMQSIFLRFLRSISKFDGRGMSLNQEKIF